MNRRSLLAFFGVSTAAGATGAAAAAAESSVDDTGNEQLRASVAIAAAMSPELRVIRIRDGSLLDDGGMKLLAAFAEERDFQIWIERVAGDGKVGFVLEDGHLKDAAPAMEAAE